MKIPIICISINHKNTDIENRKKFAFSNEEIENFLKKILNETLNGSVIISTCNRIEFYFSFKNLSEENQNQILKNCEEAICNEKNEDVSLFRKFSFAYFGENAIKHLFEVSSGLDSMILGENQILGQVRESYQFAKKCNFTDFYLNVIFQKALTCAKRIKTETVLSKTTESTATLSVKEIMKIENPKNVLVLGATGQIGSLIVKDLSEREGVKVFATFRKHYNLPELKNVEKIDFEKRYEYLDKADVVVSCTKSPHYTLLFEKTRDCIWTEKERLFLDLAVPNDIDPDISRLSRCNLKNIDDFRKIAKENNEKKKSGVIFANEIIKEEIDSTKKEILFHESIEFFDSKKEELKNKNALQFFYELKKNATSSQMMTLLNVFQKTLEK